MPKKYLIVNADDYGMCRSANLAVQELFDLGCLKSATIMMPCPTAGEAVAYAVAHPQHAIGVHLTLTSEWKDYRWQPLTNGPSLRDEAGFMWKNSRQVEENAVWEEMEAELRAQIDRAHALGMKPSHLDNHMGSLYGHYTGRFENSEKTLRLCGKYGYSYRLFTKCTETTCPDGVPFDLCQKLAVQVKAWADKYGVILPDYLMMPQWTPEMRADYDVYRRERLQSWITIPDGVTETYLHPSLDTDEIRGISGRWQDRVWEYRLMKDPATHEFLRENGVEMISHRELRAMRGAK